MTESLPPSTTESADFTPPFEYTPLAEGQIRLLRLYPAREESHQLQGELIVTSLDALPPRRSPRAPGSAEPVDEEKHVCFEAISYVWGEAAFTESVVTPQGPIPITVSLASILRRLRDEEQSRLYWADAVCINQSDVVEKQVQVSLMGIIYSCAMRVLCDVGEETEAVSLILDAMARHWRRNIRHGLAMGQGDLPHISAEATAEVMGITLPTEEEADAIEVVEGKEWAERFTELMSSPWFHRLWVVQEFVLRREVDMVFGRRHIPWGELWAGMIWYKGIEWPWYSTEYSFARLANMIIPYYTLCIIRGCRLVDPETPNGCEFLDAIKSLSTIVDLNQTFHLPICLMAFCSAGCTDPRDRYFGILGLIDEGKEIPKALQPDYTASLKEITMRFWKYAIQLGSGGELILSAGLPGLAEGFPSWLRDISAGSPWDHIWCMGPLGEASHSAGGAASTWSVRFFDDDPGCMFTRGYHLDDVSDMLPVDLESGFDLESVLKRLNKTISLITSGPNTIECDRDMKYPFTGEHIHEVALKTMFDYNKQDTTSPFDEKFAETLKMGLVIPSIARADDEGDDATERIGNFFDEKMPVLEDLLGRVYTSWGLRTCNTSKGYLGLLPKEVRRGDEVWILAGCRVPVVLRASEAHPGCFEFVGGGYVHGVMNGEVLEMPGFKWKGVSLR